MEWQNFISDEKFSSVQLVQSAWQGSLPSVRDVMGRTNYINVICI